MSGAFGPLYTSDYVFDESVTTALVRTRRPSVALNVGRMILGDPPFLVRLRVDESAFKEAWRLFAKHAERGLSFTDCASIALVRAKGIESVMSFDGDFDGLVHRIR